MIAKKALIPNLPAIRSLALTVDALLLDSVSHWNPVQSLSDLSFSPDLAGKVSLSLECALA